MCRWHPWAVAFSGLLVLASCQSAPQSRGTQNPVPEAATAGAGDRSAEAGAPAAPTTSMLSVSLVEATAPGQLDRPLLTALRDGGHVIYFRHAATDRSQQDSDPHNLANCATQRNLTDDGRADARTIGEAFRAL